MSCAVACSSGVGCRAPAGRKQQEREGGMTAELPCPCAVLALPPHGGFWKYGEKRLQVLPASAFACPQAAGAPDLAEAQPQEPHACSPSKLSPVTLSSSFGLGNLSHCVPKAPGICRSPSGVTPDTWQSGGNRGVLLGGGWGGQKPRHREAAVGASPGEWQG